MHVLRCMCLRPFGVMRPIPVAGLARIAARVVAGPAVKFGTPDGAGFCRPDSGRYFQSPRRKRQRSAVRASPGETG